MSMPIDIEVNDTKKRERLRIKLNPKYQKKIMVRKPFTPGAPKQISTDQLATSIVALDFVYYVGDKEKGLAHLLLDQSGLGIDIEMLAASNNSVMFPS
jgi:hypothetical protein